MSAERPGNSSYLWTRSISAADLASRYGLGTLITASSEADPNVAHEGVWDNRVRLVGTKATVVVSNWGFRGADGLNSSGFAITGVVPG